MKNIKDFAVGTLSDFTLCGSFDSLRQAEAMQVIAVNMPACEENIFVVRTDNLEIQSWMEPKNRTGGFDTTEELEACRRIVKRIRRESHRL